MKVWYKSKVIWLAVLQAVIGLTMVVSQQYPGIGVILTIKSVLDVILRVVTDLPIVEKAIPK